MIPSFLESAALAQKRKVPKTIEWFYWKFRDNPYGESILACAESGGEIVGCVAYGVQPFSLNSVNYKGVISFETFVRPEFQGLGIFNKLIQFAETRLASKKFDLMINFPNSNSLQGFLKNNWKQLNSAEYWVKSSNLLNVILNINEIKKGFVAGSSNLSELFAPESFSQHLNGNNLSSVITDEYLIWRFFRYPVSEYKVIETTEFYSILRIGKRGKLNEAQVLFINHKSGGYVKINQFLKICKASGKYDIISFPISKNNPIRSQLKNNCFFKVPNRTNICYKILAPDKISDNQVSGLSLNAINYHTY